MYLSSKEHIHKVFGALTEMAYIIGILAATVPVSGFFLLGETLKWSLSTFLYTTGFIFVFSFSREKKYTPILLLFLFFLFQTLEVSHFLCISLLETAGFSKHFIHLFRIGSIYPYLKSNFWLVTLLPVVVILSFLLFHFSGQSHKPIGRINLFFGTILIIAGFVLSPSISSFNGYLLDTVRSFNKLSPPTLVAHAGGGINGQIYTNSLEALNYNPLTLLPVQLCKHTSRLF